MYFPEEVFFGEEAVGEVACVVHVGVPNIDEDRPCFVFVGDCCEPGVVVCGWVPFFGAVGECVPGRPVALGGAGPVRGEIGEFLLGEGFGVEEGEVGPDGGGDEGEEEESGDDED